MPLNIDFVQILLHMLNFVILAGGLTLLLYKPVCKFLDERQNHFDALARENEEKARENEALKAEYEEKLANAEQESAALKQKAETEVAEAARSALDSAREKASAIIAAAEKEAEERKEHIMESAQTEIGELVVEAAQKLVNETATPERSIALYDEFIRELEAGKGLTAKRNGKKS